MTTRFPETVSPKGEFEAPKEIVIDDETIAALDLDMTLMQSYRLSDIVYATLRSNYAFDPAALRSIDSVEAAEQSQVGRDFPYLDDLRAALGQAGAMSSPENFAHMIADEHRTDSGELSGGFVEYVMVDGAIDYIEKLQETMSDWMVVTAGGEFSQRFKVELLRLILVNGQVLKDGQIVPFIVTDSNVSKTRLITEAAGGGELELSKLTSSSVYSQVTPELADRRYRQVILTDDKKYHLLGADKSATEHFSIRPILIKRGGEPSEPGVVNRVVADAVVRVY